MRIALLLHHQLDSGGDMARGLALARELGRRGHLVSLICEASSWLAVRTQASFELIHSPRYAPTSMRERGTHPLSIYWRWRWIRRRSFDVVHTFGVRPTVVLPALWLQRRGTVWVADWSDLWGADGIAAQRGPLGRWTVGVLDDWLERSSRRRADGLTTVSSFLVELARQYEVGPEHALHLGGGADTEEIVPLDQDEARRTLGLRPDGPIVVFSGQSAFDLDLVGRTYRQLREQRPGVRLLLLGGASAADLNLGHDSGVVEFGFLPLNTMMTAIAAGDVMLLPLREAEFNRARFPNRLGDYMAAGRPVVTNHVGDAGQLVVEEEIGLAVSDNPNALAKGVLELLDRPERVAEMGRRARRLAQERMDWKHLAARVEGFYRRLLSEP